MAIAILAERQSLATKYGTDAPYGALFSTAPLTTGAATGELTGGSPAYARKALSWGAVDGNAKITGAATVFDVAAGTTVVAFGVAASATAGTADIKDTYTLTSQTFSSQGTMTITPSYTQS